MAVPTIASTTQQSSTVTGTTRSVPKPTMQAGDQLLVRLGHVGSSANILTPPPGPDPARWQLIQAVGGASTAQRLEIWLLANITAAEIAALSSTMTWSGGSARHWNVRAYAVRNAGTDAPVFGGAVASQNSPLPSQPLTAGGESLLFDFHLTNAGDTYTAPTGFANVVDEISAGTGTSSSRPVRALDGTQSIATSGSVAPVNWVRSANIVVENSPGASVMFLSADVVVRPVVTVPAVTITTVNQPVSIQATATNGPIAGWRWAPYKPHTITITGTPTGGTFTLTFDGQTTTGIAFNATAAAVQAALEALSTVGAGNVVVTGGPAPGSPFTVTFLASTSPGKALTATGALTGGSSPGISVVTDIGASTLPTLSGTTTDTVTFTPTVLGGLSLLALATNAGGQSVTPSVGSVFVSSPASTASQGLPRRMGVLRRGMRLRIP